MSVSRRRLALRTAVVAAVAATAALAALALTSATTGRVSVGTVEVRVRAAGHGRTELVLPPLGRVRARTHDAPLTVSAEVVELDVDSVQDLVNERDPAERLRDEAGTDVEIVLRRLAIRAILLSAGVGALAVSVLPGRGWRDLPVGAAAGALAVVFALVWVWRGYDAAAFERNPTFDGGLERAPAVLTAIQRHVDDVDVVRNRVRVLGARIAELYTTTALDDPTARPGTRILHVSDIHSNPIGLEVVQRLVEQFDVDAVLDTGDLTSFGSPLEARVAELVDDIGVPYVLVPGNHDSPANRAAFDAHPAVRVLDGEVMDIAGVSILGIADPTFTADNRIDTQSANRVKVSTARTVARTVRRLDPDVLAVHDLRQASASWGAVPLVVAGHVHERHREERDGTIALTVGSTGATGLGSLTSETDLAYEAQILHFERGALVAVDHISLPGFDGSFTVEHVVVDEE